MTDQPDSQEDDQLLAEVRAAVEAADPVPPRLLGSARSAFTWRMVDAELALLAFDSATDTEVLVRSHNRSVHLSFVAGEATIDIELTADRIVGQVTPPAPLVAAATSTGKQVEVECDPLGQFTIDERPVGSVRLIARGAGRSIATDWFSC